MHTLRKSLARTMEDSVLRLLDCLYPEVYTLFNMVDDAGASLVVRNSLRSDYEHNREV